MDIAEAINHLSKVVERLSDGPTPIKQISSLIVAVAALAAAITAIIGLFTWRAQIRGPVAFDLSRKLLANTYRFRDLIRTVRSPIMFSNEMSNPPEDSPLADSDEGKRYYQSLTGYQRRIEPLDQKRTEMLVDINEAEALWGQEIREPFDVLFRYGRELVAEIQFWLDEQHPKNISRFHRHELTDASMKREAERMKIVYATANSNNDDFASKVEKAIKDIEAILRPHLKKHR